MVTRTLGFCCNQAAWLCNICWSCASTSYWSVSNRMRSDDTEATKSSWLPLTGPEGVAGPPVCAEASPPGAGGSSCGGFFEQAARATMAVAISKGRESFIGLLLNRSEEHTYELQPLMRISYAVFCMKKHKHKLQ